MEGGYKAMSKEIDERVVEMRFDNKQFEKNVATTMNIFWLWQDRRWERRQTERKIEVFKFIKRFRKTTECSI